MIPLQFEKVLKEGGISLDGGKGEMLERFVSELLEWNSKINLISRKDTENVWEGHILHSLVPLLMFDIPQGVKVLDLGTGGGLPGIPMAIVHGGMEVTLLDSIAKKMAAVEGMAKGLGMSGISVVTGRAEEVGRKPPFRSAFDMVVARAVAPLADLVRWSRPFLRRRRELSPTAMRGAKTQFGFPYLLTLKGGDLETEVREARVKGGPCTITVIDILFRSSSALPFEGKKVILVEFP
jgi:16S rRNA (guanine527-N7)-methyltransferase